MNPERLPLFPLQVVLFPHAALPLHIFEERYKVLIRECVKDGREFGVVLLQEQGLAQIGCSAAVTSVLQSYDDGRMDIIVEGRRRFRMIGLVDAGTIYSMGSVLFLEEPSEKLDVRLAAETINFYNRLAETVYGNRVRPIPEDLLTPGISYVMAQKAGMDLGDRQRLLEISRENDRLRLLNEYFRVVLPRLQKKEEIERIIRSDGYIVKE